MSCRRMTSLRFMRRLPESDISLLPTLTVNFSFEPTKVMLRCVWLSTLSSSSACSGLMATGVSVTTFLCERQDVIIRGTASTAIFKTLENFICANIFYV